MTRITLGAAALLLGTASTAAALGLDRSAQDIGAIFEPGNFARLSFGYTQPTISGTDRLGNDTGNIGRDFSTVSGALTFAVDPSISVGIIVDQPYGADVRYEGNPATTLLGGTAAELDSLALTFLGRYRFDNGFSVHAGARQLRLDGAVTLSGQAYGPLNGYNVTLDDGSGWGYVVGGAFERPDIALRVALTYSSAIDVDFDSVERVGPAVVARGTTTVTAPESVNLDFQTGIAADTLLFGQIRWADYPSLRVTPPFFGSATGGGSITDIEDTMSYTLGIGRRLTDQIAGRVSVIYEPKTGDDLKSPLTPYNGQIALAAGIGYDVTDQINVSGGVRYTWFGDAAAAAGGCADVGCAPFDGNTALSVGMQVAYRF